MHTHHMTTSYGHMTCVGEQLFYWLLSTKGLVYSVWSCHILSITSWEVNVYPRSSLVQS